MAKDFTEPVVCTWQRSQLTSSTDEITSWQMTLVRSQPSMAIDLTLALICSVECLQFTRMTRWCFSTLSASSRTRPDSPSKFSITHFCWFSNLLLGGPRGPLPLPAGAALCLGAALAATGGGTSSFDLFFVFMSAVTFFSPPVLDALMASKIAAMPAPGLALVVVVVPSSSLGFDAKPPLGIGGAPLPLPFGAPVGAAAVAPKGFASK
mmetsp:Transcript_113124/g.225262  ORF Transcript_113124/g.225262 Transcript_113124/m.225262 type:complete len:208 (-) Transcript_113124:604-1227(-)